MILYQEGKSKKPIRVVEKRTPRRRIPRVKKPKKSKVSRIKSLKQSKHYPGDEAFKKLIVKYQGNITKIGDDPSVKVKPSIVSTWINDSLELRILASEQRQLRKSKTGLRGVRPPSNPGKEILEALLFNYDGKLDEMIENPNIKTDVETLRSWIEEEGLESLVKE